MIYDKIKTLNKHIDIKHITDSAFSDYGRIIENYNFTDIYDFIKNNTVIPKDGNKYEANLIYLETLDIKEKIEREFYGEMPIQIGYCNGRNSALNGLEYHKGNEINIAVTDLILLLGKIQDIKNNSYESYNVEAFFVPEGYAIEIYATTLHFAPCKVHEYGFKCAVILPEGTNLPLNKEKKNGKGENKILFAKNKWLLVHESKQDLIAKGAYAGIKGDNIHIKHL